MSTPDHSRVPLQSLPRVAGSWTFVYIEHARIDRADHAVSVRAPGGTIDVPIANLTCLMLGPGTNITHEAVKTCADCGVSLVWSGEAGVKLYASGMGETRSSRNLLHQATAWADEAERMRVVLRMYRQRFQEELPDDLTLEQVRGKEGVRVRTAYSQASQASGIPWKGRNYDRGSWASADPVNQALSTANACLYGVCHAAIVALGFSPALGFIHTGKQLSFVYDIADLYKVDLTIPLAFRAVQLGGTANLSASVRRMCRDAFFQHRLLARIVPDIQLCLGLRPEPVQVFRVGPDPESADGLSLWDPGGPVAAGVNHGDPNEGGTPH